MNNDKLKVLIVEDSYIDKIILKEAFRGEYRVLSANNGLEALTVLEANPDVSIILLDLLMPVMDGFEVIKKLKTNPIYCNIPVVVVTASEDVESQIKAFDLGAYDVLFKPLNTQLVIHRVHNIMTSLASVQNMGASETIYKNLIDRDSIDEKSGIYTQKKFIEATRELLKNNHDKQYYLLRFDIDGFKVLNDACGLAEGDRLLEWIGEACIEIAEPGVVYGRWETDHFVVCMDSECFERQNVPELATRIFEFDNPSFNVSLRLGIYKIDDTSLDVRIMSDRALMALKSIKGSYSRHYAFFDESMREQLIEEQQIVNECEEALKQGQFIVYLQPQFNYSSGTLHGAEALVRWMHPTKGMISPGKFIPIFEKNGFITQLDEFVWSEVCSLQRKWLDEGIDILPVSVNVSRVDISSAHLFDFLNNLIKINDLPKNCLRLEITESAYMDNPQLLVNSVKRLQDDGFSIEMDDFGSGYSSLNTLKDVPVDMLKLDMKFLENGKNEDRGGSILSSVVRMSNWLRLPVIAEGVENKNQADYLKSIGCMYMQGFYFAKPMPAQEYEVILKSKVCKEVEEKRFYDDMQNAYRYLNATDSATFVFNCFVGGAAIAEYDNDILEVIRINDRFYQTLGAIRGDFYRQKINLFDALDAKNKRILVNALETAINIKQESSCEVSVSSEDSGDMWVRVRIRLLAINSGKALFYIAVDDITESVNLLENNRQMAKQLNIVMNSIPCGVIDYEIRNDSEYGNVSIKFFNTNTAAMFGYERDEYEELFGNNPMRVLHKDDRAEFVKIARETLYGEANSCYFVFRHICKDGTYKPIRFTASITRKSDDVLYVTGVMADDTLNR